ncbi:MULTISPECIES: PSPA7_2676 family Cys-rich small protein [unclassified Pseudomonas]|nr:PSPA7_2676 family Cys-rich small protein [Pseudomonas sp. M47T1]
MSIICLIKGCEWMACPLQLPGMALMTCERCERCGALRYHSTVVQ